MSPMQGNSRGKNGLAVPILLNRPVNLNPFNSLVLERVSLYSYTIKWLCVSVSCAEEGR